MVKQISHKSHFAEPNRYATRKGVVQQVEPRFSPVGHVAPKHKDRPRSAPCLMIAERQLKPQPEGSDIGKRVFSRERTLGTSIHK